MSARHVRSKSEPPGALDSLAPVHLAPVHLAWPPRRGQAAPAPSWSCGVVGPCGPIGPRQGQLPLPGQETSRTSQETSRTCQEEAMKSQEATRRNQEAARRSQGSGRTGEVEARPKSDVAPSGEGGLLLLGEVYTGHVGQLMARNRLPLGNTWQHASGPD